MDMTICPHCQRSVPAANFDVHSAQCTRVRLDSSSQDQPVNNDVPEQQRQRRVSSRRPGTGALNNSMTTRSNGSNSDWVVVNDAVMSSPNSRRTATQSNDDINNPLQLGDGQWRCVRCTLINQSHHLMCGACMSPRYVSARNSNNGSVTERNVAMTNRISNETLNGSNITYRRTMSSLSTANRVLNGAINGAMVGSIFGGVGGLIVGGITGAASGMFIDRLRSRGEQQLEDSERDMLLHDNGGLQPGIMRVHRGENYITAASINGHGSTRVVRLRYGGNLPGGITNQEQIERTVLGLLLRSSYNRPTTNGAHVIIQPEATFEELLERFGSGLEGRGASQEVIDSYPVEVVGADDRDASQDENEIGDGSESVNKKPKIDMGTCSICLEDYQVGDEKKSLSCPHAFHKGCIDQWLKRVASCPVCKAEVCMKAKPTADENIGERSS